MTTQHDLYTIALTADAEFSAEGRRVYGKRWGDMRYQASKWPLNSKLHTLLNRFLAASDAWHDAQTVRVIDA